MARAPATRWRVGSSRRRPSSSLRDLRTDEGAFASALDADTVVDGHSHEGLTYAWTPGQLVEVLGEDDGRRAADAARR